MSKDINFTVLNKSGKKVASIAKTYAGFSFFIIVLCIYGFLVFRISVLSKVEPSDDDITAQSGATKRLKIDQASIDKINQLNDQNVSVQSLFQEARDNPFQN